MLRRAATRALAGSRTLSTASGAHLACLDDARRSASAEGFLGHPSERSRPRRRLGDTAACRSAEPQSHTGHHLPLPPPPAPAAATATRLAAPRPSRRSVLRLEGKSLLSYLQGVISNDATKLAAPGAAPLYACVLTPQVRAAPPAAAGTAGQGACLLFGLHTTAHRTEARAASKLLCATAVLPPLALRPHAAGPLPS